MHFARQAFWAYFWPTHQALKGHVLTTHRLACLCCQCDASLDMKPAPLVR